jgi:hypothetical protein
VGAKVDNVARRVAMPVRADHERLKLLAKRVFDDFEPPAVVTYLNQTLKTRGLTFGLRRVEGRWELAIYDTGTDGEAHRG